MSKNATVLDRAANEHDVLQGYFDLIVERAPVPVCVVDAAFRVTNVNQPWLSKLGCERSEVLGRPSTDFLSGESREFSLRYAIPLFREVGSARSVGVTFETTDGRIVPVLLDAQVCCVGDGPRHAFAVLRDPDDPAQYAEASATFTALSNIALSPREARGRPVAGASSPDAIDDGGAGPSVEKPGAGQRRDRVSSDLTMRERAVLRSLASGARNKEIAAELGVGIRTARFHVENIYQKLNVHTRTQATRAAIELGLVTGE